MNTKKKEQRFDAILTAFTNLLHHRTVRDITMQQLAEETGLAVGTLYNYFPSKRQLVEAVFVKLFEMLERNVRLFFAEARTGTVADYLKLMNVYTALLPRLAKPAWEELINWVTVGYGENGGSALWDRFQLLSRPFTELTKSLQKEQAVKTSADPETAGRMLFILFYYHLREYYYSEFSPEEIKTHLAEEVRLLTEGLSLA